MRVNLVNCEPLVAPFMEHWCGSPGQFRPDNGRAIAVADLDQDDPTRPPEIIAGCWYEAHNGPNIVLHCASTQDRRWLNRAFLYLTFAYPFLQMGVKRITSPVAASNTDARKFIEHIGFTLEASLKGASNDGSDMLLYVMFKEDCRWLGLPDRHAKRRMH